MTTVSCIVNGEPREVPAGQTLADLLSDIGLRMNGVAIAVEQRVVSPNQFTDVAITPGMRIEIVRAVGGG